MCIINETKHGLFYSNLIYHSIFIKIDLYQVVATLRKAAVEKLQKQNKVIKCLIAVTNVFNGCAMMLRLLLSCMISIHDEYGKKCPDLCISSLCFFLPLQVL